MISIIIPCLNEEKYIPKLLQSIKAQDFGGNLEIIVADAGSKDKSREIAQSFGCKVIGGGLPGKARNEGAKIAQADILMFVDADVVLPPDFLKKALNEFFQRNLDGATFYTKPLEGGLWKKWVFSTFYNVPVGLLNRFLSLGAMVFLVKKEIHQKLQGFDEEILFLEDTDYVKRLSKIGRYGIIKGVPIFPSTRRFEKDGWARNWFKVALGNIYMLFFGPIKKDIFKYKFNHYENH